MGITGGTGGLDMTPLNMEEAEPPDMLVATVDIVLELPLLNLVNALDPETDDPANETALALQLFES